MFRTTSTTILMLGMLATLAGMDLSPARGETTEMRRQDVYAIVAQSTRATAATGRRPIGQRISASNLPVRAPAPPAHTSKPADLAPTDVPAPLAADAPLPGSATDNEGPLPPEPDTYTTAAEEEVRDGEPRASAEPEAEAEPQVLAETAPRAIADDEGTTDEMLVETTAPARLPVDHAHPRHRVHDHTHPAPPPVTRERLLGRIKTAFGVPARGGHPSDDDRAHHPVAPSHPARHAEAAEPPVDIDAPAVVTAAEPADAWTPSGPAEPARLEFDVRESRSLVGEGEQLVMRIAVRNIGGESAERVTATLFFAEGVEPVQAIGQAAELYPGEVRFETVPQLPPGASVDLLVTAVGIRPGSVAYRGEVECRAPAGRVAREGTLTVRPRQATP